MLNFNGAIQMLVDMGIADVFLPFILIFTIIFAIMEKANILGEDRKVHGVIAFSIAMGAIIPHVTHSYPANYDVVNIINQALPNVSVIAIAIVCALILMGIFGHEFPGQAGSTLSAIIWVVAAGVILYIFGSAAGWFWKFPAWLDFLNDSDTQALIVIILVFALVIRYITKDDDAPKKSFAERYHNLITPYGEESGKGDKPGKV
jgi:hypothetical protein